VLHPEVVHVFRPAIDSLSGQGPVGYARFAEVLGAHVDATRPAPSVYLLTKVGVWVGVWVCVCMCFGFVVGVWVGG
jgi:hypothetical protein